MRLGLGMILCLRDYVTYVPLHWVAVAVWAFNEFKRKCGDI